MKLRGSCACGAVSFELEAPEPYPYMRCYCSVCRKTAGGGGFAINLGAKFDTLRVSGEEHVAVYRAKIRNPGDSELKQSKHERSFCHICGSHLWAWHPKWPDLVLPLASAIDTPLPTPPETAHIMLEFKANWVMPAVGPSDHCFDRYPKESLEAWHKRLGLLDD
ncbi:MAG: alanine acetyltransferase [Deltaproteobacteria bacterium RIFOXYA12_FULL_58_15]|nr:MAG: alanine acetyltransferase [Deltaproteobacteria bacterium RIFOXYA12_FULL_58_15]OGR09961.1 MAG: alanine acetyltransferase [Deltaproteobacteria bacterium RIFOXYB12_FULL_58_9]